MGWGWGDQKRQLNFLSAEEGVMKTTQAFPPNPHRLLLPPDCWVMELLPCDHTWQAWRQPTHNRENVSTWVPGHKHHQSAEPALGCWPPDILWCKEKITSTLGNYSWLRFLFLAAMNEKCASSKCCVCVCTQVQVHVLSNVWLFVTLWTIAYQATLSMELARQEYWSELPTPGDLLHPIGIQPKSLVSPALAGRFFATAPPGKPKCCVYPQGNKTTPTLSLWKHTVSLNVAWIRKWQPTLVFLPGKSYRGAWWATVQGGHKELDTTEWLSTHTPNTENRCALENNQK